MQLTKNKLFKKLEGLNEYQLRIVLGFVERLFRP